MRFPLLCLLAALFLAHASADEPFFKKGDVIALVGGEDMVVASENGYLETVLIHALPDYHLRFRNLAWEGDTVFEQHRDLNFPSWEEQLDKIGATVVICQFGEMESFDGKDRLPEFIAAYGKLLDRFSAGGKRRLVLFETLPLNDGPASQERGLYADAIRKFAESRQYPSVTFVPASLDDQTASAGKTSFFKPDGIHLSSYGQQCAAGVCGIYLTFGPRVETATRRKLESALSDSPLRELIVAKNRLWFNYWRIQNWAFLAGDRTNQPSSRDWRDPSKRWFPAEREEFLPLIEAKEKEIDELAAKTK